MAEHGGVLFGSVIESAVNLTPFSIGKVVLIAGG